MWNNYKLKMIIEIEDILENKLADFIKAAKQLNILNDNNLDFDGDELIYFDGVKVNYNLSYTKGTRDTYLEPGDPAEIEINSVLIDGTNFNCWEYLKDNYDQIAIELDENLQSDYEYYQEEKAEYRREMDEYRREEKKLWGNNG